MAKKLPVHAKRKPRTRRAPRKERLKLLVIEGDSEKLVIEGLSHADLVAEVARTTLNLDVQVIKATDYASFAYELSRFQAKTFENIVLIGHGNADGLQLVAGDDGFVAWHDLSAFIKSFRPRRLLFLACQSGRTLAARDLFAALPSLRDIIASPVNMNRSQAWGVIYSAVYAVIGGNKIDRKALFALRAAHAMLSRGLLFHFTREEHEAADVIDDLLMTAVETALPELLDVLWSAIDARA